MIEYIKLIEESIYNFVIGFWLPLVIEFFIGCLREPDSGEEYATYIIAIFSLIIYCILLIPLNIIFYKNNKDNKIKRKIPTICLILGSLICIYFRMI